MNKWAGHVPKMLLVQWIWASIFLLYIVHTTEFPLIHKRQVKNLSQMMVVWQPHSAAVQFLLLQFDIWLPKKGERRRRSRRWDCGGCWGLKAVLRKLDFHAAVKRPAGVEIGYTEPPAALLMPFYKTYYRYWSWKAPKKSSTSRSDIAAGASFPCSLLPLLLHIPSMCMYLTPLRCLC